ncbi:YfhO family protein [Candidatus Bathyarchaeota archaeon]|nr:MAG: YfhO family protein [Candidatus Bathyarchaeota archaeon]
MESPRSEAQVDLANLIVIIALVTVAVSLFFLTAATVHLGELPPDSFFFVSQLPLGYWLGLLASVSLFLLRNRVKDRARTLLESSALILFSAYLFALPSLVYQDPRVLDSYQHEGDALVLLNSGGWYNGPVWYVYQFPGAYTFFAQLTAVAGIDPFQLIKYYPAALAVVLAILLYATTRTLGPNYSAVSSGFILSGLWFQLHLSPQSLELIPYVGIIYILVKMIDDEPRRKLWSIIALVSVPVLVMTHPETPLVLTLGTVAFFLLKPLVSAERIKTMRSNLLVIGPFFLALSIMVLVWWTAIASGALAQVESIVKGALAIGLGGISHGAPNVPTTPAPSYQTVILIQETVAVSVWLLGLSLLLFVRRFRTREYFLAGLFLAAISTIPVALFANADVLQRSYLFSLFPTGLLLASLLERGNVLRLGALPLARLVGAGLILMMIAFSMLMPIARYGGDSFDYLPQSSLFVSDVASGLTSNSVMFPHPGEYGWRFYAPSHGNLGAVLLEQKNIAGRPGGYVKFDTYAEFNLTFTQADNTSDYILVSNYYQNLYLLRFGSGSTYLLNLKMAFEAQAAMNFNLVYSTGTDRLYENRNLS